MMMDEVRVNVTNGLDVPHVAFLGVVRELTLQFTCHAVRSCNFSHFPLSFSSTFRCVGAMVTSRCTEPETLNYKLTRLKRECLSFLLVCGHAVFVFCTPECVHTLSREC